LQSGQGLTAAQPRGAASPVFTRMPLGLLVLPEIYAFTLRGPAKDRAGAAAATARIAQA